MKKVYSLIALLFIAVQFSFAQNEVEKEISEEELTKIYQQQIDSINKTFTYQYGKIMLKDGLAEINVPEGYKFLNADQANRVLTQLWGNPPSDALGMLFPKDVNPVGSANSYAVEITYSDEGYIKDEEAKDLDYDDLLEQMQDDTKEYNPERKKQGYPTIDLVGWASAPFYDPENKKLHWAKELHFEGEEVNTLNYEIRVLGRKGYLNLNAIGNIDVLPQFKKDVTNILNSVSFTEGNTYADFNPDIDKVAAYGIAGLIAGKVLAKAGVLAIILKFWKIIAIAVAGGFAALKNKIFGPKEENV